jgi:hypothetical protein
MAPEKAKAPATFRLTGLSQTFEFFCFRLGPRQASLTTADISRLGSVGGRILMKSPGQLCIRKRGPQPWLFDAHHY